MDLESNKAAALAIIRGAMQGGLQRAVFTDDAVWWMQGSRELPMDDFIQMNLAFHATQVGGEVELAVHGVTAEGERVAVEVECNVPLRNGGVYNGTYHFLICLRHGKAYRVKEYFDTAQARDALRRAK